MIEIAVVVGLAVASGMWLRTRARHAAEDEGTTLEAKREEAALAKEKRLDKVGTKRRSGPRGLLVSDVLLYADTELWLAGMIELQEEELVVRMFPTPGSKRGSWVVQLDPNADEVMIGKPTDLVPNGRVPDELPMGGMRVSMRRRGQATVSTEGEHLPHVTENADYNVLGGPGGRTLVVVDFKGGDRLAIYGERLSKAEYDLLPGGD